MRICRAKHLGKLLKYRFRLMLPLQLFVASGRAHEFCTPLRMKDASRPYATHDILGFLLLWAGGSRGHLRAGGRRRATYYVR